MSRWIFEGWSSFLMFFTIYWVCLINWESTTVLRQWYYNLTVFLRSHPELWIGGVSFPHLLGVVRWKPTWVHLGPRTGPTDTCPVFWEINVDEKSAEIVLPVIVVHHENTIIGNCLLSLSLILDSTSKLLLVVQFPDLCIDSCLILFVFCTSITPSSLPFTFAPRISQYHNSLYIITF